MHLTLQLKESNVNRGESMKQHETSDLVGKSFEDLSVEEMNTLQGADGGIQPNSESVLFSLASTVASAAVSGQVSKAISTLVTYFRKCA